MRKLLGTAAVAMALMAPTAQAQTGEVTEQGWEEVKGFLERNPDIYSQLQQVMANEISPDQVAEDAAYIEENAATFYEDPLSPVLGNPEGEVLVVKFTDFRCPHCRNVTPELKKLIESDPRVKLVVKEFPILGPDSVESAKFALAARQVGGDEAYKIVQEALFNAGNVRMTGYFFEELAEQAGIDPKTTIEAMDSPEIAEHLATNAQLAQGLKITGTPAILVDDIVIRGSVPFESLSRAVDETYGE